MTEADYITDILNREGRVYTNRTADKGGPTKFGITQSTLSRWRSHIVTPEDVKAMEEPEARSIYLTWYLGPWRWIPDERLRVLITDWYVTTSPRPVIRALQSAVRATADGVLGSDTKVRTLAALATNPQAVYNAVLQARIQHYTNLALNDPKLLVLIKDHDEDLQIKNLRGWLNRCAEFL